jgi:type II secretory pathway pseudopilin PulG
MHLGKTNRTENGFSLIETMLATVILMGGMLGLAAVFTQGVVLMSVSQTDVIAKQKAMAAIESVFTARDTRVLTWAQVRNAANGGIFLDGPQPLYAECTTNPPNDGMANTADDSACPADSIVNPGPDGLLATGDDRVMPLMNFTREVEITDAAPNLRRVRVIVRYKASRLEREYVLTTFVSSFA